MKDKILIIILLGGLVMSFISLATRLEYPKGINIPLPPQNATTTPYSALGEMLEQDTAPKYKEIEVRTTCYLETGNNMANGKYPEPGYVATSDRSIPFGTIIEIDGVEYKVGDRTNKRFQYFDKPTIDIYVEWSREDCLKYGVKNKIVKIYETTNTITQD